MPENKLAKRLSNLIWRLIPVDPQDDKGELEKVLDVICDMKGENTAYEFLEASELEAYLMQFSDEDLIALNTKITDVLGYDLLNPDVITNKLQEAYAVKKEFPLTVDMNAVFEAVENELKTDYIVNTYEDYIIVSDKNQNTVIRFDLWADDVSVYVVSEVLYTSKETKQRRVAEDMHELLDWIKTQINQYLQDADLKESVEDKELDGYEYMDSIREGGKNFAIYRKIINGKGSWRAQREDMYGPIGKSFPITYEQALKFEPLDYMGEEYIPDATERYPQGHMNDEPKLNGYVLVLYTEPDSEFYVVKELGNKEQAQKFFRELQKNPNSKFEMGEIIYSNQNNQFRHLFICPAQDVVEFSYNTVLPDELKKEINYYFEV